MKRLTFKFVRTGIALALLGLCGVSHADADSEREKLAVISNEIQRLQELVAEASKYADRTARPQFRYDYLLADLKLVKDGVDTHQDAPRQPRQIVPLKGDYRR
jgi:RAQPRD family integrative conjugative element protein